VRDDDLKEFGLDGEERRAVAETVPVGTVRFNKTTGDALIFDGAVWRSLTREQAAAIEGVPPPVTAKGATELLNNWRKMWPQAADYLDKMQKMQSEMPGWLKDLKRKP